MSVDECREPPRSIASQCRDHQRNASQARDFRAHEPLLHRPSCPRLSHGLQHGLEGDGVHVAIVCFHGRSCGPVPVPILTDEHRVEPRPLPGTDQPQRRRRIDGRAPLDQKRLAIRAVPDHAHGTIGCRLTGDGVAPQQSGPQRCFPCTRTPPKEESRRQLAASVACN